MKIESRDIILSVTLIIFALLAFLYSNTFSTGDLYGPDLFPKLISIIIGILGLYLLISSVINLKNYKNILDINHNLVFKIIIFIIVITASFYLFSLVGFIISSVLFLVVAQLIFGVKNYLAITLVSIFVPLALYLFFTQVFNIPIP